MASMTIKDQQLIFANYTGMGMLMEYLFDSKQAKLIISPAILTDTDHPI